MTTERPTDIVIEDINITSTEVAPDDHGVITANEDGDTFTAEAAVEITQLPNGQTKVTLDLGDAQLTLTYDRESWESAERAAVLLASGPQLITQAEAVYDAKLEGGND